MDFAKKEMKEKEKNQSLNAVEKAILLLDCFLNENQPLSLKELTEKTGWPKSTVHNLLSAMRRQEIIVQNEEDGRYSMGIHVFQLGNAVAHGLDIIQIAKPYMRTVAETVNRSVHLTALRYPNVVLIARSEPSKNPLKMIVAAGTPMALYYNAHGKLFLAHMPDSAVEEYLRSTALTSFTSKTITDPQALRNQIQDIREQGYAVEKNERNMGIYGVAAPVLDAQGKLAYGFGVVGFFSDINSHEFIAAIRQVRRAAYEISLQIGYKEET